MAITRDYKNRLYDTDHGSYGSFVRHLGGYLEYQIWMSGIAPVKKIGRNDPCICGSNKKYKKCCLTKGS